MSDVTMRGGLSERTASAGRLVLRGHRLGVRGLLPFAGPAVVASVAYMDPGNFATNIQGGAQFGYELLWVVLLANVTAMLFQALSARLGIVTGRNLAELSRDHLPRPAVIAMWLVSEVAAMATDLAEFLGASIGLALLLHIPLLLGMVLTAVITYALLTLSRAGFRPLELVIGGLVATISLSYIVELLIAPLDWGAAAYHSVVPVLSGPMALTLAVGIFGATVMPHAIYLHSGLTQGRLGRLNPAEKLRLVRLSDREVMLALGAAGLVNMAMLSVAAAVFHTTGHQGVSTIEDAYRTLEPLLGGAAAGIFMLSLLASGLSSSVVGTMAGQMIMQGFVGFRIPLWLRRVVTMAPAFVVVAWGVNATQALVLSQVVLSLALPVPMIALLAFSARKRLMGRYALRGAWAVLAVLAATLVLALNIVLLAQAA